ncbi:hypothetical protein TWF225_003922 [Orbilia oligospora]|nr:hypothetical protein TWF225_003922 [Orbilia oligospora]KAF3256792.1 hypothetical protein TWF128_005287 [Orbilia oligospora]KAF3258700.1 hypothetical protein TWF217_005466 [Orbilia oligospora]KAF3295568.1 hypothetical protein TWF132_001606 [Orbilia oligospora]
MSSLPVVPPRPTRASATSPTESSGASLPVVPARPVRDRSKSPLPESEATSERPSSPDTKRKIDPDLDLHQPMAVRPAAEIPKATQHDDIPEIGQRVPMLDFAGDVQAPSPAADSRSASRAKRRSQHAPSLPPSDGPMIVGDFGAYPAGKVYRQNGSYSLSHDDLTKSVMTASGAGVATTPGLEGVPDEEIGYIVSDEIASRDATPQGTPGGVITAGHKLPSKSPLATAVSALEGENDNTHQLPNLDDSGNDSHGIYGKGGLTNASSTSLGVPTSGRHTPWEEFQDERAEGTPILASDEAGKYPVWNPPAISPRLSAQEVRRPPSSNRSRTSPSLIPTEDLDDEPPSPIKEHVPLFPEGTAPPRAPSRPKLDKQASSQRFPSKDVWEDAPESSHATYEVEEEEQKPDPDYYDPAKNKITEKSVETEVPKETPVSPPVVPTRPTKRVPTDETSLEGSKAAPAVPERPKVPPRPIRKIGEPTSADSSSPPEDSRAPPPPKPKPVIPGRVGGGIAALRANFMSDLNSRLSKGPVAPKKEEPAAEPEPKEREPLEDVRKTRARGPAKRKPSAAAGATPAAGTEAPATAHVPKLTFSSIITVYSIGDDYEVSFDETKFDDEPSKIARPIDDKVLEAVKAEETEEKKEEKKEEVSTETEEKGSSSDPVETVKDIAQKVVDAVVPTSSTTEAEEESKPESTTTATEEKTVVA